MNKLEEEKKQRLILGENIRDLRICNNMSQDDLAKKLGYKSRSTINKIEMGINRLHPTKVYAFAKALGTSPAYLLGLSSCNIPLTRSVEVCFDKGTQIYFFSEKNIMKVITFLQKLEKEEESEIKKNNLNFDKKE